MGNVLLFSSFTLFSTNFKMPKKLTEQSWAVVNLRKQFATGEINSGTHPKNVWSSDPLFLDNKLDNFCTKFNKPS